MISQARRGALSNRGVVVGYMVMYVPIMHITNRYLINIYREEVLMKTKRYFLNMVQITKSIIGQQHLLNDCYVFTETLHLMCSYGTSTSLANH